MDRFARLVSNLHSAKDADDKLWLLRRYLEDTPSVDSRWALFFLLGGKIPLRISPRQLQKWLEELRIWPEWMIEACHARVGNLSETVALLLPPARENGTAPSLHVLVENHLLDLVHWDERAQFQLLRPLWRGMDSTVRWTFHKMLTGNMGVGVRAGIIREAMGSRYSAASLV